MVKGHLSSLCHTSDWVVLPLWILSWGQRSRLAEQRGSRPASPLPSPVFQPGWPSPPLGPFVLRPKSFFLKTFKESGRELLGNPVLVSDGLFTRDTTPDSLRVLVVFASLRSLWRSWMLTADLLYHAGPQDDFQSAGSCPPVLVASFFFWLGNVF